jgi:hypothetical protein
MNPVGGDPKDNHLVSHQQICSRQNKMRIPAQVTVTGLSLPGFFCFRLQFCDVATIHKRNVAKFGYSSVREESRPKIKKNLAIIFWQPGAAGNQLLSKIYDKFQEYFSEY